MTIEDRVKAEVSKAVGIAIADIKNENELVGDLCADSLDLLELVMAIEDEFGIEVSDEDGEKITTVQQAIDYVSEHVKI
jgi:acyl carrier protein